MANLTNWDRPSIIRLLETNDRAVEKALLVLLEKQTASERSSEVAIETNGVGFSGFDAEIFTSFAKQVRDGKRLSRAQLLVCRKPTRGGIKIGKYWKQLLDEIQSRQVAA